LLGHTYYIEITQALFYCRKTNWSQFDPGSSQLRSSKFQLINFRTIGTFVPYSSWSFICFT